MKIYVLTTGSYSDYRIVGVFSSKEKIKEYFGGLSEDDWPGDYDVEEYDVDNMEGKPEVLSLCVYMRLLTGNVSNIFMCEYYCNDILLRNTYCSDGQEIIVYFHHPISRDAAIKATNEIRCRLKSLDRICLGRYDRETLAYLGK